MGSVATQSLDGEFRRVSLLDRPVWAALSHSPHLTEGGALAKRFRRDINVFAAARADTPPSLAALGALVREDESVYLVEAGDIAIPDNLALVRVGQGVQMLADRPVASPVAGHEIIELGDADAAEMIELARLTEPGPFLPRTHTMGRFRGVRLDGRLVAMAGERMRFPGFTELSGVCTHPDFRGRGLARRLSAEVAHAIQARGEVPILHSWAANLRANALYESLGFAVRTTVQIAVVKRRL